MARGLGHCYGPRHAVLAMSVAAWMLLTGAAARDVPDFVRSFYNTVKPGNCSGSDLLQGGFYDEVGSTATWSYCQQDVAGQALFIKGSGTFADMDIDCDGSAADPTNDTRCASSTDTQDQTTFQGTVQGYGIPDLDARIHPYVVLGNQGNYAPTFDPAAHGVQPLSVVAVVCGDQLVYGIWGDTNGDDGPPLVGEASLAMGTLCFGQSVNGNSGHDPTDVLYVAFTGAEAVPGANGALWNTTSTAEFEASIEALGNTLIQRLNLGNQTGGSGNQTGGSGNQTGQAGGNQTGSQGSGGNQTGGQSGAGEKPSRAGQPVQVGLSVMIGLLAAGWLLPLAF